MIFTERVSKHTRRQAQAWRRTSLSLAVGLLLSSVAMAQSSEGTLYGQAKASSTVTVTSLETGSTRQVQTDASGKFSLAKLQPGRYTVSSGGDKQEVTVSIGSGTQVVLGGTTLQQVQVTGSRTRSAIDVASVESNTVFTQEQLQSLPVPRNVNSVALLAPGVVKGDAGLGDVADGTNVQRFGRSGNADGFWASNAAVATNPGMNSGALQISTWPWAR